ncbi:MAG: EAL domain-containing protein [Gammaproteobacteria bacterium]
MKNTLVMSLIGIKSCLWAMIIVGVMQCSIAVAAAELVRWGDQNQEYTYYDVNEFLSYHEEFGQPETIDSVVHEESWTPNSTGEVLNFGFVDHPIWVRFPLAFDLDANQSWHLVIPYPLLQYADVYVLSADQRVLWHESLRTARRDHKTLFSYQTNFSLPDAIEPGAFVYIKASSNTSLQLPLEIWNRDYLIIQQNVETLLWGLYFGLMLALILYNNFLFISLRDPTYIYYVFTLISVMMLMLTISGFGNRYVWRDPEVTLSALPISAYLVSFWLLCFCISFLKPENITPWIRVSMQVLAGLIVVASAYVFFFPERGAFTAGWVGALAVFLILFAGMTSWLKGQVVARYFVLATASFGVGSFLYIANVFGALPSSKITNHSIQAGSVLEALLFSFALAHRFKEERRQKLAAMKKIESAQRMIVKMQDQALQQALHDPVSRKPNEYLLSQMVSELIVSANGVNTFALILMNFPQIKQIAASMGRRLAEEVFVSVIVTLEEKLRDNDWAFLVEPSTNSFVSVQEFGSVVVVCKASGHESVIREYVKYLIRLYDSALRLGDVSVQLDVCCGVSMYPRHGDRADLLLQHASAAWDYGQRLSERMTVYSTEIDAFVRRRLALVGALSQAVKDKKLILYFQPQFDCLTQFMTGAEVLLRWNSDQFGLVSPVEFIEVAEEAGMMSYITRYLVDEAFSMLKEMNDGEPPIKLSINLSTQNLTESNFVEYVLAKAEQHSIDLSHVVFEVTETCSSENMDKVIKTLDQLGAVGCCISLDDYGTGYSSLAYLSQLPVNELKIDRSFVSQTDRSVSDYQIVENTVKLARALQIETVAEGVENLKTFELLMELGCNRVQGFYFARPMPMSQFRKWLGHRSRVVPALPLM